MIETKNKKAGNAEKFFFDQNCFDDDYVEEIIEEEPPPPVFSEEELAAARKEGYEHGKKDGLAEAAASREKHVAGLLETISRHFKTLFDAEQQRARQYEGEAVMLAHAIFAKLFPALDQRNGLGEIEAVIRHVLENHREQPGIVIEVRSDYREDVARRLGAFPGVAAAGGGITVNGADDLGPGDCRMHWHNGGGGRDAGLLAEEIYKQLEHILADKFTLQDNGIADAGKTTMENTDE